MSLDRTRIRTTMNLIADAVSLGFDFDITAFERIELEALLKEFSAKREQPTHQEKVA